MNDISRVVHRVLVCLVAPAQPCHWLIWISPERRGEIELQKQIVRDQDPQMSQISDSLYRKLLVRVALGGRWSIIDLTLSEWRVQACSFCSTFKFVFKCLGQSLFHLAWQGHMSWELVSNVCEIVAVLGRHAFSNYVPANICKVTECIGR